MAMVTTISPGGMQPHHHLVPPPIFAQMLGKTCEVTFGQPFQLLIHFSPLLVGENTFHPRHDSDLHFQRQHATKRFVLGIHQPSTIHADSAKHENGASLLCSPYSSVPWTNPRLALGLGVSTKKVYPLGVPPRISSRGQTPPRDVFPPISSSHGVSKSRCALRADSFEFVQSRCFKMVSSLQSIVLFSVPIAILFDMLKILHHLPMGHECFRALFRRCTHEELRAWAKTLPWDHPIARKLDHEVHRRRMAGEFYGFHFFGVWVPFPYTFFLIFFYSRI